RTVVADVCDGDVRADRRVHLVVVLERPAPGLRGRCHRSIDAARGGKAGRRRSLRGDARGRLPRGVEVTHALPKIPDGVELRRIGPRYLQLRGRFDRVVLFRRDHDEEVADVDDLDVGQML